MKHWLTGVLLAAICAAAQPAAGQLLREAPSMSPSLRDAHASPTGRAARQQIHIVGSSSMGVYTETVARDLTASAGIAPPNIHLTGTREGIRRFCAGHGLAFPDIAAASRRMSKGEFNVCVENGVVDIIELPIGLDAVLLVTERGDPVFNLTPRHIYLALAAEVPRKFITTANVSRETARRAVEAVGEDFMENPFTRWSEIDGTLPDLPIRVYGPSVDSGTRDLINSQVLEAGCRHFGAIRDIYGASDRVRQCTTLREAPHYNVVEEPFEKKVVDALIKDGVGTLGFVSFDTFELERTRIDQLPFLGMTATVKSIASGEYALRRTIYYYVKRAHMRDRDGRGIVPGLRQFMADLTREEVIGPGGLFDKIGFVPLSEEERALTRRNAAILRRMER